MEAEERPPKLRKLSHEAEDEPILQNEPQSNVLPQNVFDDGVEQQQKTEPGEHAYDTDADNSFPKNFPQDLFPDAVNSASTSAASPHPTSDPSPTSNLSKNQLKKLRKKQEWEAGREDRKIIRKQKAQGKKARKRAAGDTLSNGLTPANGDVLDNARNSSGKHGVPKRISNTLLPITLIIDCAFDDLMHDTERTSLSSQITRSYSDNYRARYKAHLAISSFGGKLRERFDTLLSQHYKNWKGVRVLEEDYVEAAERAKEWMGGEKGGKLAGAFTVDSQGHSEQSVEKLRSQGETIYLTSDSENTLDRLKPYSTYIIGGLVDKNRHKGICYKSACERGIKTAKLPIGEYMEMQSRFVLATNHVVEIVIRWLECGDWGQAFLKVIPKRKGGKLKQVVTPDVGGGVGRQEDEDEADDDGVATVDPGLPNGESGDITVAEDRQ
ncbi:hypothetical protein GJ744_005932 [Endocarpon pusillum]|uniref:tRNA (guanine(9)-N1)-methyltransferase n=1 Tax=Endocarpon pusillum TaxID=364733 RepID=A0A8H7APX4_9EURO|nr:hypothetical protein GJ744_005932 [Endocarpon pusillum]